MKPIDFDEARRFIALLGKPAGAIRLRAFLHRDHPDKGTDKGRKGGASKKLIEQWQAEGRGVYVVINDGGDTNADITACRAFFAEWDDRPREWQLTAWQSLKLPEPTFQITILRVCCEPARISGDRLRPARCCRDWPGAAQTGVGTVWGRFVWAGCRVLG